MSIINHHGIVIRSMHRVSSIQYRFISVIISACAISHQLQPSCYCTKPATSLITSSILLEAASCKWKAEIGISKPGRTSLWLGLPHSSPDLLPNNTSTDTSQLLRRRHVLGVCIYQLQSVQTRLPRN